VPINLLRSCSPMLLKPVLMHYTLAAAQWTESVALRILVIFISKLGLQVHGRTPHGSVDGSGD